MLELMSGVVLLLLLLPAILLSMVGLWEVTQAVIAHKTGNQGGIQCATASS